jgi:hypothetical protein
MTFHARGGRFTGRSAPIMGTLGVVGATLTSSLAASSPAAVAAASVGPSPPPVVVLATPVRDSINAIFVRFNRHWDELARVNTLTQMLGTGPPTQHEYLGCLIGDAHDDTVRVTDWAPARDLKQLQFAVTGSCEHVPHLVGTWHTHPYRAAPDGRALKEPLLSAADLSTFSAGQDRVVLVAWDVDSVDVAVRALDGSIRHPAPVVVR